ncbi:hypothetical protein EDF24_0599 [Curtobacterium sp. PhB130]|uniref:hypothetical protein n=1 Tax=unclassified Curtobacterium TaxID=257496 RepID=UPI000F4D118A|nr:MULTISPECIES: hypothetical protein [unclassified Curtobacterium]ROP63576.1 hypothetical protein EDF55_2336 [Curtobacterium sp. ZW137]ROS77837.1 hypothetical protein EDF24_0599 [Curtobacterium sp. PhB130]
MRTVKAATAFGFVRDLQQLIDGVLPEHGVRFFERRSDNVLLVRTQRDDGDPSTIPLRVGGAVVADLDVRFALSSEPASARFRTETSQFRLLMRPDREPLARFEYERTKSGAPVAHWHVHSERGAFTTMLATASAAGRRQRDPSRLSTLHYPVGGSRFRPSIEEFLVFLIEECGVDSLPGWRSAIADGQARWVSTQAGLVARENPEEAAAQLRSMGWLVEGPGRERVSA